MKRVLVVDDIEEARELLRVNLQDAGYAVDEAADGLQALERARQSAPDLVLSDLLMPGEDGYAALRRWKADPVLRAIPFVVYTASYTDPRDEQLALDLGADGFILKPIEHDQLLAVIERALQGPARIAPQALPGGPDDRALISEHNAVLMRKLAQRDRERERDLQAVIASTARFQALFDHSRDIIMLTRTDGSILAVNPAACQALGLSEDEIIARGRSGVVDVTDARLPAMLAERAATGHTRGELTLIRGDGTKMPVELTSTVFVDGKGDECTSLIARDITERQRIEAELRHSQARQADLQAALDAHALVTMTDAQGCITYANDRFCATTGYTREELIGRNHRIVRSGVHDDAFFAELWRTVSAGRIWRGEVCSRTKGGSLYWVDATITPFLGADGRPVQYAAIRTDITARKREQAERAELESQLRQAQKMQAVGTLASGIAHDFNNVLAAILGFARLAAAELDPRAPAAESIERIRSAAERARALVQRLLAFGRRQPTALRVQALQPLVDDTLALLRGTLPAGALIERRLPAEPVPANVDATQLAQVLLNLCTNAAHALPGGSGRIEVGLARGELPPALAALAAGRRGAAWVHLWVRDDGCGMDGATQARVFDPFFTTRAPGEGTGLGLSTVYGIVQGHGGGVTLESSPGQGSTFHVWLPPADAPAHAPEPAGAGAAAPAPGQGQCVLYVDDDETLCVLAERLLARAGYAALTFNEPAAALAALRAGQPCTALFTDSQMPRISGLELARQVLALRPGLPIFLCSGHIDDATAAQARATGLRGVLHKERLVDDLLPRLQQALATPAPDPAPG